MNTTIPFELLLLNDLLNNGSIDKDIYDMAAQKIVSVITSASKNTQPLPASA